MTKEQFWNWLTVCTDPRSFKYDTNKKTIKVELPILPDNVKYFRKNIFSMLGSPETPTEEWELDPLYHGYKFDSRYISIDCETITYNQYGQLQVDQENIIDVIENKALEKLGIDIKNDIFSPESFEGFNPVSHNPFVKNEINFSYISTGLDYSNKDNWYLFPQHIAGLLDIFIIYPTMVNNSEKGTSIDVSDLEMLEGVQNFLKVIIPIFKNLPVNLYMPKYHQFNGDKLEKYSMEWFANNDFGTRDDIYNAFGYFLKECQGSNNFITFSHDQGSILNYFLATDFIQYMSPELLSKWKNIWAFGVGLDNTILDHTSFISSGLPTDTGTIISWNLATSSELSKNRKTWGNGTSVGINPITFTKTYGNQLKGSNISLLKYFDNLHQISSSVEAKVTANSYENEIVQVNLNENTLLSDEQIEKCDLDNMGYLHDNTIGLFAENIRNNIISRYSLI
jgi:hypothetical protein